MLTLTTLGRQYIITRWVVRDLSDSIGALYVAYTAGIPPSNADGTQLDEPGVSGYSRCPLPLHSDYWAPSGYGEVFNTWAGTWAVLGDNAGYLSGIALCDAPGIGTGNVIATGMIAEPFDGRSGTPMVLAPGDITIGLYE